MPVALVELIRAEQVLEVPAPNTSRDRAGWKVQQQRLVKDRMLVFVAVVIDVAVVANLVVGITALSQRSAALGVLTGIIALERPAIDVTGGADVAGVSLRVGARTPA